MRYLIGRQLRFTADVTVVATGVLVDPANLTLSLRSPAGLLIEYTFPGDPEVVHDGVGEFHCDYTPAESGTWNYRYSCTGAIEDAAEDKFGIDASHVV